MNEWSLILNRWLRLLLVTILGVSLAGCGKPAPLDISYRPSLWDSAGLVLIVTNSGPQYLSCRMNVASKVTGEKSGFVFSLGPHAKQEIGAIQAGWSFKSGEKVSISVEGHATRKFTVP